MGLGDFNNPLKSAQQKINDQLKRFSGGSSPSPKNSGAVVPPIFGPLVVGLGNETSFFRPYAIDGSKWDKLFPYRLLVVDVSNGNKIVSSGSTVTDETTVAPDRFTLSFQEIGNRWEMRLPITPESLRIATPFAIDLSPTLRGMNEEGNGVKFKMINFSGSMGQWPYRPTISDPPSSPNILTTLFGGTLEAFEGLTNQINRVVNTLTQNHPANKPTVIKPEETAAGYQGTGYYMALFLDQFLEQYAEAKKDPANKHWRLVFDMPKTGRSYVVTPIMFEWIQNAEHPQEVKYNLQLKAWRRIDLAEKVSVKELEINPLSPDLLTRIINAIDEGRRTLASAYNLIGAVRSDVQTPFNILRELSLFAKDLAGLPAAVIDLPRNIIQDSSSAIKEIIKNKDDAVSLLTQGTNDSYKEAVQTIKASSLLQEGVAAAAVAAGNLGAAAAIALRTDPTVQIFANPEQNFELFNQVSVDEVNFSVAAAAAIDTELDRIRQTTVDDMVQDRASLLELALQLSNNFGAGNDTYNAIYRRPSKNNRITEMNIDENDLLVKLYDVIQAIDLLTATDDLDNSRTESAFEYVGSLAAEAGMTFQDSTSKIRLPVPFGLTMEQIALRYLGDPDRWVEIAALNALKSPYIDEDGFSNLLLSNADGRQFNIDNQDNLFIGQKVTLMSTTQPQTTRRIINIERISDTNFLITVDGLDNLGVFTIADNAKMKAYLPGTVNSADQIYIPSDLAANDTVLSRPVPATAGDPLVGMSKVDILLGDDGDIAMNSFGECKIAAGLQNFIQALKMKFKVPPRGLVKHQTYGAGVQVGISSADITARDVYKQIKAAVDADPRFNGINRLEIDIVGPKIKVSMSVNLANGNGVFPISFVLNE